MARPYRLQAANCWYHIMSRGDDRKRIYTMSSDYGKFLDYVMKAKERYQFYLYAYCLMANHFHLGKIWGQIFAFRMMVAVREE